MNLTAEYCQQRREKLMSRVEADLLVISNPRHVLYLSGLVVTPLALSGWGPAFLLIETSTGATKLLVHNFLAGDAHQAHVDEVFVYRWYDAVANAAVNLWQTAVATLSEQIYQYGSRRTGIELGSFPFSAPLDDWVDLTETIRAMRRRKYPDELALIRGAIRAIEAGHRAGRAMIRPGVTELDVYSAIHAAMVTEAGAPVLPLGDYASGKRANRGGGPPTTRILQAGELMILDLFPVIGGYRADFTATVSVDGTLTDKQQALQAALHAGIAAGEGMLRPGSKAADVYAAVYQALSQHGFAGGFGHHAGHGLGLGHPEAPFFVPYSDEVLVAGDVVTLEPGSYGADFGARIEHNYLISEAGFERLTRHETQFASTGYSFDASRPYQT